MYPFVTPFPPLHRSSYGKNKLVLLITLGGGEEV